MPMVPDRRASRGSKSDRCSLKTLPAATWTDPFSHTQMGHSYCSVATAALRHRYAELSEAGVEVWELPGTVVHAKVVVADDVVSFGTVNLDS